MSFLANLWFKFFYDPEKNLLFLGAFTALFVAGPGKYSLDAVIANKLKALSISDS